MEHRGDIDHGFDDPESPLDVGQRLVARDHLGGVEIGGVRHQQQLAIVEFGPCQSCLVDGVGEQAKPCPDNPCRYNFKLILYSALAICLAN